MAKRPLGSVAAISGVVGLIAVGAFHCPINGSGKAASGETTDQQEALSGRWRKICFPIDDSDGLEFGCQIGNWMVKKIKSQ